MTRKASPSNQNTVPVLDKYGIPVSPTRPSRARRLVRESRAVRTWKHGRFAIRLIEREAADSVITEANLGIDPGAKTTGMTVTVKTAEASRVVTGTEVHHRGHRITQALLSRRSYRRNRRSRIRRRPARFNNRTRREGWIPPSLASIEANIVTNARHLLALYPVRDIILESCKFDPRLLADPDIFGEAYQHSERSYMQVREYVLQRDKRTCQYCGQTGVKLELDHLYPRSRAGSNRVSNLLTACHDCNLAKGNMPVEEFLKDQPDRLRRGRGQLRNTLSSATHMSVLMPRLKASLVALGLPLTETDAVNTAYTRGQLGIEKTHVNDAACLGEPATLKGIPDRIEKISAVGHGKRQMLTQLSRYGTPRFQAGAAGKYRGYRAWCRLPRTVQGFTTMPGHKLRARRSHGICSGDLVRYFHPDHGMVIGPATLVNNKKRVTVTGKGSLKAEKACLLQKANGYRYETAANKSPTTAN